MTKEDLNNLRFILTKRDQGQEVLEEWLFSEDRTLDELNYALELLHTMEENQAHFKKTIDSYFE